MFSAEARERYDLEGLWAPSGGMYRSNAVDPQLESAWLQPLSLPLDPS
jgi:hypothetical protein